MNKKIKPKTLLYRKPNEMKNSETNSKTQLVVQPKNEIQKGIENHKKAANHFKAAAKNHLDAAKHHENGHHEKAAESTVKAHGHSSLANEAQKEDVKHHTPKI